MIQEPEEDIKLNLCISIVIPFHPAYPLIKFRKETVKDKVKAIKFELFKRKYPAEAIMLMLEKLETAIDSINYLPSYMNPPKGLVIYLNQDYYKHFFLPFIPEEKLLIKNSLEIRDTIYAIKNNFSYVIIAINQNETNVFESHNDHVVKQRLMGAPYSRIPIMRNPLIENPSEQPLKYLTAIDKAITKNYGRSNRTLIVTGPEDLISGLSSISRNKDRIKYWMKESLEHASEHDVLEFMKPILATHYDSQETAALASLRMSDEQKISKGLKSVWQAAYTEKIEQLIVEKDFKRTRIKSDSQKIREQDLADEIIEKVLTKGGDVHFVRNGKLDEFMGIASINRY